jgi:hypothetical protein
MNNKVVRQEEEKIVVTVSDIFNYVFNEGEY